MTISVVIPAYNSAAFLRETLGSVFAQTRLPEEIVVVDDASSDDTLVIAREVAANSPVPLRVIELARNCGGPATPLNVGIEAAQGDYISLLDHDDVMLPDNLAAKSAITGKNDDIDLIMADYASFSKEGVQKGTDARGVGGQWHALLVSGSGPVHRVEADACLAAFVRRPPLARGCSNMFFRKAFWTRSGGFDPAAGPSSDYEFLLRTIDRPIVWLDSTLFLRREHDSNLWQITAQNLLQTLRSQRKCLARRQLPPDVRGAVVDYATIVARDLRVAWHLPGALRAAWQLVQLGEPGFALRECRLTCTFPFRVAARKVKTRKQSSAAARNG